MIPVPAGSAESESPQVMEDPAVMPSASERVAAKLAAKQAAAATPVDDDEEESTEAEETTDDKPMTLREKAAAARAARKGGTPKVSPLRVVKDEVEAKTEDEDEDEDEETSEPAEEAIKPATRAVKAKQSASGKKQPSLAQIAAREKFAARSRAAAAERAKASGSAEKAPIQTPEQIKAKQNADRKKARADAEAKEAARPARKPTGKPVRLEAKAVVSGKPKAGAKTTAATKSTKAKVERQPRGDSPKVKILALWEKGKSRAEIQEALGVSYASVYFHTKGTPGTGAGKRGSIFVKIKLDEDGNALPKGKTEEVNRSEAFRREFLSGEAIGDIARKYEVKYQIVYTACRGLMDDEVDE